MNPNQALWDKGDFTAIAAFVRQSGDALVNSLGVTRSVRVLDGACGAGNRVLPLARLAAEVVGVDIRKTWSRRETCARQRRVSTD